MRTRFFATLAVCGFAMVGCGGDSDTRVVGEMQVQKKDQLDSKYAATIPGPPSKEQIEKTKQEKMKGYMQNASPKSGS